MTNGYQTAPLTDSLRVESLWTAFGCRPFVVWRHVGRIVSATREFRESGGRVIVRNSQLELDRRDAEWARGLTVERVHNTDVEVVYR